MGSLMKLARAALVTTASIAAATMLGPSIANAQVDTVQKSGGSFSCASGWLIELYGTGTGDIRFYAPSTVQLGDEWPHGSLDYTSTYLTQKKSTTSWKVTSTGGWLDDVNSGIGCYNPTGQAPQA